MRDALYCMTSILHMICCMVLFMMVIFVSNSYNVSLCQLTWCIVKLRNLASCLICSSCNWFCFCRVCKFSLILAILLALEYTPHPSIQVNIPILFMQDKFLCNDGLILYNAFIKNIQEVFLRRC